MAHYTPPPVPASSAGVLLHRSLRGRTRPGRP
jgi:hypothetical protein